MGFFKQIRQRLVAKVYRPLIARHDQFIAPYKADLFRGLGGSILEIGPGPGSNLKYLKEVDHWVGVEPNRFMHPMIETELKRTGIDGTLLTAGAESLPFEDQTFDAVIGTLVLCSVSDPVQVISELYRVLRPGGRYCFVEHVAAPRGSWLRRFQRVVRPCWRCCGDGCQPDRETAATLHASRFDRLEYQEFRAPPSVLPAIVSPHISGTAWVNALD